MTAALLAVYKLVTDLQSFTAMMASTQVVETSVNTDNSPSQDYTTSPDDHSNHNIDSPGFKPFTVIVGFLVDFQQKTQSDADWECEFITNVCFVGYFKPQTWVFN